jgi:hypothetical protein
VIPEKTWHVVPRGRIWYAMPAGDFLFITLGGEPNTATNVETDDHLDLEGTFAWEAGLDVHWRRHRVRLSYEQIHAEGENLLDEAIVYHGDVYPAGTNVTSDVDLDFIKAGWDFRLTGTHGNEVRAGLAGWVWTFDGTVSGGFSGESSRGFTHVYPLATVDAATRFGAFTLGATLQGGLLDDDRFVIDAEGRIGLRIANRVQAELGYRWMRFAFHATTNVGDLTFHGPFVQVSIDF